MNIFNEKVSPKALAICAVYFYYFLTVCTARQINQQQKPCSVQNSTTYTVYIICVRMSERTDVDKNLAILHLCLAWIVLYTGQQVTYKLCCV